MLLSRRYQEVRTLKAIITMRTLSLLAVILVCAWCVWSQLFFFRFLHYSDVLRLSESAPLLLAAAPAPAEEELRYEYALATLRCFATPGCFPSSRCRTGVPKKIPRKKKWEEHAFCVDDLRGPGGASYDSGGQEEGRRRCLVYSFGIFDSWEWEEKVARLFGCEVHAFDPTVDLPANLAPGVAFHRLGLQGEGTDMAVTNGAEYEAIDGGRLLSLGDIMTRLGHENRILDVLMMDCEGCEWGVLREMACKGQSARVRQLIVEFHFQKNLGLRDEADVLAAAEAVACLERDRWEVASIERSGSGPLNWEYARGIGGVIKNEGFLMYLSLQRTPEGEQLFPEIVQASAAARQHVVVTEEGLRKKHGDKINAWPQEARSALDSKIREREQIRQKYLSTYQDRAAFDEHPRMDETAILNV